MVQSRLQSHHDWDLPVTDMQKKTKANEIKAQFRGLVRHPRRNCIGPILQSPACMRLPQDNLDLSVTDL